MKKQFLISFIVFFICSIIGYSLLAFQIERDHSLLLLTTIILLFGGYFFFVFYTEIDASYYWYFVLASFVFRALFMFATPMLSDDFNRFIWDGRLLEIDINPFLYLPDYVQQQHLLIGNQNELLYHNMNSPHYFTVYPPVLQFIFYFSAKLSLNSNLVAIILLRLSIFIAEIGTFVYISKLLTYFKLSPNLVFIYLFNPLIIIELCGNLHFEGVMLFFISSSLYYLFTNKTQRSAILFALAICSKMIPLILLPLVVKKLGMKQGILYSVIAIGISLLLFSLFINQQLINNIGESVGLYFQKFEFNASIYYLCRWIGFQFVGYNAIATIGKVVPLIGALGILIIANSFKNKESDFFEKSIELLSIYYLFALIIHPWYVSFLVLFSVFSNKRFALVWSLLIMGTYLNYSAIPYQENLWFVAFEYLFLLGYWVYEYRNIRKEN